MSVKGQAAFLSLLTMTGIYYAYPRVSVPKTVSDFVDAPISEQLEGRSFGGASGRITGKLEPIQIPIPPAPPRPERPKTESGLGPACKPFLEVGLNSAAIAGATPQATRENVGAFFEKFGLRILSYRDNDSCGSVLLQVRKPDGLADTVRLSAAKRKALSARKELEEVKDVYPDGAYYRIIFAENLYPSRIREMFSVFPDLSVVYPRNDAAAGGVRAQLSADDIGDLKAVAAGLKKQFPSTITYAEVKDEFTVVRFADK